MFTQMKIYLNAIAGQASICSLNILWMHSTAVADGARRVKQGGQAGANRAK